MKQKIYIVGLVTTLLVFIGTIFKVNHFPGAGIMLTLGLVGLVVLFLPLALVSHYKSEDSNKSKTLYIVTWLTCFVLFISMLFKIQHWPFAGLLLTIALPLPYVLFLPVFINVTSKNKNHNIYNTVAVLLLLAINSIFAALLALNVAKDKIDDSYDLANNYNRVEAVLNQLPANKSLQTVSKQIDDVIQIINEYQEIILKEEECSPVQWHGNSKYLRWPTSTGVASAALEASGDIPAGTKLKTGLKNLITTLEDTKGCKELAISAPVIFDFINTEESNSQANKLALNSRSLVWTLIYLDGLRVNLQIMKEYTNAIN
jgi:gliding motility-associated GldL-like protein